MPSPEPGHSPLLLRLPLVRGSYRENVLLSKKCWFGVGGSAEILYRPEDKEDLQVFLQDCPEDIPVTLLGVGSNVLVRDGGISGVTIQLGKYFTHKIFHQENIIEAGTANLDISVARYALDHCIGGLEFLSTIPGTLGGAIAMNAGCYGSDIASCIISVEALDRQGKCHVFSAQDMQFVYRGHLRKEWLVFTNARLQGIKSTHSSILHAMEQMDTQRKTTQPLRVRTGGSTFKNPPHGLKAWELIDQAGCRHWTRGEAAFSNVHCNFLINKNAATAYDLEQLILDVKKEVARVTGYILETEIRIIGDYL